MAVRTDQCLSGPRLSIGPDTDGIASAAYAHLDSAGGTVYDPTCTYWPTAIFVVAWTLLSRSRIHHPDARARLRPDGTRSPAIHAGGRGRPQRRPLDRGTCQRQLGHRLRRHQLGQRKRLGRHHDEHHAAARQQRASGGPIHVNIPSPQVDGDPSVSVLDNGMILVTWHKEVSRAATTSTAASSRRRRASHDRRHPSEFLISSAAGNDTYRTSRRSRPDVSSPRGLPRQEISDRTSPRWSRNWSAPPPATGRTTSITGDALRDVISSGGGNDTIMKARQRAVARQDVSRMRIDGGAGDDTAVFPQPSTLHAAGIGGSIYRHRRATAPTADESSTCSSPTATIHVIDDGNALFDTPVLSQPESRRVPGRRERARPLQRGRLARRARPERRSSTPRAISRSTRTWRRAA